MPKVSITTPANDKKSLHREPPKSIDLDDFIRLCRDASNLRTEGALRELVDTWQDDLPDARKREGLRALYAAWASEEGLVTSQLANACWSRYTDMASHFKGAEFLKYSPREVRTVALYHYRARNGGAERVVTTLCNSFAAAKKPDGTPKYRVVLITDEEQTPDDYYVSPSVARVALPARTHFPKEDFALRARAWAEAIEEYRVDVVLYSHWYHDATLWDLLCVKGHPSHPAFVFHIHNCWANTYIWETKPEETFGSFDLADGVVCLSTCDTKYWKAVNPRVYFIGNPVAFSSDSPRAHFGKEILWLGRLSDEKQPLDVIPIMQSVLREVPDAVCRVVGGDIPRLEARLAAEIMRTGLEGHVVLEGFQTDVARFYENASVFLMTSKFEGFGLTYFESALHGLPGRRPQSLLEEGLPEPDDTRRHLPRGTVAQSLGGLRRHDGRKARLACCERLLQVKSRWLEVILDVDRLRRRHGVSRQRQRRPVHPLLLIRYLPAPVVPQLPRQGPQRQRHYRWGLLGDR